MVLAMTRPTKNRNGTYQTRIGIPANLRDVIGKSELKRSLGTIENIGHPLFKIIREYSSESIG